MLKLLAPAPLCIKHKLDEFESGEFSLDEWLKRRALKNQASGASRCFVLCDDQTVIGYYTLSAGAIAHEAVPKNLKRNMPNPLPILLLGRLAIDKKYHNKGLGSALLRDAMIRSISVAQDARIVAILVHALTDSAKQFYISRGFVESPLQSMTLFMTLETIRLILAETH